jgi:hypothetical protein
MVVHPEPPKGQRLTPSPFVDALQSAIHELRDVKAAASSIKETSAKSNIKQGVFFATFESITAGLMCFQLTLMSFCSCFRRPSCVFVVVARYTHDCALQDKVAIDPSAVTP